MPPELDTLCPPSESQSLSTQAATLQRQWDKMGKEKNFYAVRMGRVPGIYKQWHECEAQTRKFKNAVFKIRPRMPRPFSNGFGLNRFKRGRVVRSSPWLGWACRDTVDRPLTEGVWETLSHRP